MNSSVTKPINPSNSKKRRRPVDLPRAFQTVHLRLLDTATGQVSPLGGFTLAYRANETVKGHVTLRYAYVECSLEDNYCRGVGRNIAAARLDGSALDFSSSVRVALPVDADLQSSIFQLDQYGTVDVKESVFDLRGAVLQTFIDTHLSRMYADSYDLSSVVIWQGRKAFLDLDTISPCYVPVVQAVESALLSIYGLATRLLLEGDLSESQINLLDEIASSASTALSA